MGTAFGSLMLGGALAAVLLGLAGVDGTILDVAYVVMVVGFAGYVIYTVLHPAELKEVLLGDRDGRWWQSRLGRLLMVAFPAAVIPAAVGLEGAGRVVATAACVVLFGVIYIETSRHQA